MNEITVKSVSDALEALTEVSDNYGDPDTAQSIHLLSIHISAANNRVKELETRLRLSEELNKLARKYIASDVGRGYSRTTDPAYWQDKFRMLLDGPNA